MLCKCPVHQIHPESSDSPESSDRRLPWPRAGPAIARGMPPCCLQPPCNAPHACPALPSLAGMSSWWPPWLPLEACCSGEQQQQRQQLDIRSSQICQGICSDESGLDAIQSAVQLCKALPPTAWPCAGPAGAATACGLVHLSFGSLSCTVCPYPSPPLRRYDIGECLLPPCYTLSPLHIRCRPYGHARTPSLPPQPAALCPARTAAAAAHACPRKLLSDEQQLTHTLLAPPSS